VNTHVNLLSFNGGITMNKGDLEGVKTRLVEGRTALLSMLDER